MELFTCNIDGSDLKQLTSLGKANWAPFYHPSGKKIIFSSITKARVDSIQPVHDQCRRHRLEQITYDKVFDSFPMFSPTERRSSFLQTGIMVGPGTPTCLWQTG